MRKIIFIILFLAAVIGLFVLFYRSFDRSSAAESDVLDAVPQSAALIFETAHAGDLWHDLSQSNLIWEELQATDMYFRLNELGLALDSMLTRQPDLRSYLADLPSVVSVHSDGASSYNYLLAMPITGEIGEEDVIAALYSLMRVKEPANQKNYDGVVINSMRPRLFDSPIHAFVKNGVLVISLSEILAEESIRALQQEASVKFDTGFMKVRKTKGDAARGQLYVNYAEMKAIIAQYASQENTKLPFFKQPFAEWSALDLKLKASSASLNGFVLCSDSTDAWLGAFRDLRDTEIQVLEFMPANTAFFAHFGFGDFTKFRANQAEVREQTGQKYSFEKAANAYSSNCDCELEQMATSWIGTQMASFITEPASENYVQNHYGIFHANDLDDAWTNLTELENSVYEKKGLEVALEEYRGYEIHQLLIGHYYRDLLSQAFAGLENPYFTKIEDMIVMANSVNALRNLISQVEKGNTLANNPDFKGLTGQFSSEPQFLMYSSLARSPFIYQNILGNSFAKDIAKQTEVLRKFQAFIYEVSYFKNDLFYNNIYFKHNPQYDQETNALWELQIPTELMGKPHFVKNHYTGANEIVVQDIANRIYLLSNTGKVIWEKALDGPIMGDVRQIDIYKNNKLQMLFNTEQSIYLLDRNGAYVESFPVRLENMAVSPVSVVDYDGGRDYRIFIATDGGGSAVYDANGKKVEGWKFTDNSNLTVPFEHIRIRSKDYLFTINEAGKIHLLNRKGKTRHDVGSEVLQPLARTPYIIPGDKIETARICYVDSSGNAVSLNFDDRFDKLQLTDEGVIDFAFEDVDGDEAPDWIVLTSSKLSVFKENGDEIFAVKADEGCALQVHELQDGMHVGFANPSSSEIVLFDSNGSIHQGFPLYGQSEFVVGDMNGDGNSNLITIGSDGFVYAYALE